MEDESEKMVALKKVYAEIMMNTSKEAAERIIVSQRKAHEYRCDLDSTKEEAIRLLVRLKQSMDFKINEVEERSQDQQRKIDELEAQLQEAEDIVGNLRAELNLAHMKLDKLSNKKIRAASNVMANVVEENGNSQAVTREPALVSQAETINHGAHGHLSNGSLEECGCSGEPEVPSIITRRKETELYRNGCTQRIRACDGNLSKGHFSPAGGSERHKNVKEGSDDKECERISVKIPTAADTIYVEEQKSSDIKDIEDEDTLDLTRYLKILRTRRRKTSVYPTNNISSVECVPHVDKVAFGNLSTLRAHLPASHDIHKNDNDGKGTRSDSSSAAPSDFSEMGALPNEISFQSNNKLTEVCADGIHEDLEVASSWVSTTQLTKSRDSLGTPDSTTELDMKNSSSNSDIKLLDTCDGISGPQKDKILKYTFQRKRKRDYITDDDCD